MVVNLAAISHMSGGANDTAGIHLQCRPERPPVGRSFLHLCKQMRLPLDVKRLEPDREGSATRAARRRALTARV